jgi:hypothetical protein
MNFGKVTFVSSNSILMDKGVYNDVALIIEQLQNVVEKYISSQDYH